ncbi:small GTPase superfamily [Hyaloscypha sp. PMI_1271]|nr:small GTPase superfamily [Hyaloscypha sp. PMI_1271]
MVLYKLVVLGDGNVGKTGLIMQVSFVELSLGEFANTHSSLPTTNSLIYTTPPLRTHIENKAVIDGQLCMLEILDTTGQEEYTVLRDQWIRDGEGFVLVYSIDDRSSFTRINSFHDQVRRIKGSTTLTHDSLSKHEEDIELQLNPLDFPVMLVGHNCDRLVEREVSKEEGQALARELGCEFLEASAKICINVEKTFYDPVRILRRQRLQNAPHGHSSGR